MKITEAIALWTVACLVTATLDLRPAFAQVIEGDPPTTTTGDDDGGSSDNTLSFVLLGAVIAVVIGVGLMADRDNDRVELRKTEPNPLTLVLREDKARDTVLDADGIDLITGLAFNAEF
jgi:hypothetical protein